VTALLLTNRIIPAMFLLLLFGAAYGILSDSTLLAALREVQVEPRFPTFALSGISFNDFFIGMMFLALPQVPLTLGNAVIAITEENNRLFPHRPVNEGKISTSTGLMNLLSASVGGVPMCHGAGGMAGHVQFGARTGGALVILGAVLLVIAIFFSSSVATLLRLFPAPILGVILFLTGAQLALGACDIPKDKGERFALMVTGALAVWTSASRSSSAWQPIGLTNAAIFAYRSRRNQARSARFIFRRIFLPSMRIAPEFVISDKVRYKASCVRPSSAAHCFFVWGSVSAPFSPSVSM